VNVPASTRNSPTKPHNPGSPAEASTSTKKQAPKIGIFFHSPPKSAKFRVWRRS